MLTRFFYMTKPERSVSKQGHLQPRSHLKTRSPTNLVLRAFSLAWLVTKHIIAHHTVLFLKQSRHLGYRAYVISCVASKSVWDANIGFQASVI